MQIFKGRITAVLVAGALVAGSILSIPQAQAATGTKSLASVLTAKNSFDMNSKNYDILTAAVLAVLKAKPASPVKVLTDGSMAVTAFIPTDMAFENLVTALTGKRPKSEAATFTAVAGLGIDTVEQILEYHVVPGTAILSGDVLKADGAVLVTALTDKTIKVSVSAGKLIQLRAFNKKLRTPKVIFTQVDINKETFR